MVASKEEVVSPRKLRVGLIGCGRVAEHHARFITQTPLASLVGLADADRPAAERFGTRFGVQNVHETVESLLDASNLDILHVATPPAAHFAHAMAAIERGVHVLIEKPIALRFAEVEQLYQRAAETGASLCPDFIQLFHPKMQQALSLVDSGMIGRPVHVEAHLGTDGNIEAIRDSIGLHWSWNLPGGILHNYLTHPLYLALQFTGEPERLSVSAKSYGVLPQGLTDHVTVLVSGEKCTANIVLSMATKPERYYIQINCETGIVVVDFDTMNIAVRRVSRGPRAISRLASDPMLAGQLLRGTAETVIGYARKKVVPYQGLQRLISLHYEALLEGRQSPVSPALGLATARAEERIFAAAGRLHLDTSDRPSRQAAVRSPETVLVTGASGYLGRELCRQLVEDGVRVRALVRPLSKIEPLEALGVELFFGDIRDASAVNRASKNATSIVHLAALLRGAPEAVSSSCVAGTRNVADAARTSACRRVIYVSSFAIYDYFRLRKGQRLDEASPLERFPEERGTVTTGKCRAEEVALTHLADGAPAWTILRPSLIVGNGRSIYDPIGSKIGATLMAIGSPRRNLKLIHVADVAAAIRVALSCDATKGRVFTLSDGCPVTAADYVAACIPANSVRTLYLPYWIARVGLASLRTLRSLTGRGPTLNLRRLRYLFNDTTADSQSFTDVTGWRPKGNLLERLSEAADVSDRPRIRHSVPPQPIPGEASPILE